MVAKHDVVTRSGLVRGHDSESVVAFKGIPFAASPVGRLRFAAPEPPPPWSDILDAADYGPVAPQLFAPLESMLGRGEAPQSEAGCLTLNVWTPAIDDAKRPVMVWVHGGAFVTGSGAATWYDGSALARRGDVVVVTFNYRLGVLGFMYLGVASRSTGEVPANFGLLDQLAALSWVRDNVQAFGGDPERVTVFGQSAGAMSIGALFGSRSFPGLARRVALQSGACAHTLSEASAVRNSRVLADRMGLSFDSPDLRDSLRAQPIAAILAAQSEPLPESLGGMSLLPVLDGVSLTKPPLEAVADGAISGMDVLVGTNADEARLFMLTDPSLAQMDDERLRSSVLELYDPERPIEARKILEEYRASRPGARPHDLWSAITTDTAFRVPAIRLAEAASEAQRGGAAATFAYLFKWRTPAFGGIFGSCHSLEIPFVFDNLDKPGMAQVTGSGEESVGLAGAMADAWVAFARHGRPVLESGEAWAPYSARRPGSDGTQQASPYRATMCLGTTCGMIEDPDGEERSLWEGSELR